MAFGLRAADLLWRGVNGGRRSGSSPPAKNNQLRTGADKGNPTV